jgi:hypothetical protein
MDGEYVVPVFRSVPPVKALYQLIIAVLGEATALRFTTPGPHLAALVTLAIEGPVIVTVNAQVAMCPA